ncbi:hypothetical protein OIU77_003088 [Salix suchowensis]|uniref:Uncharacterized protein n=1 Tax=Salix suchowensis TaxID=1278906 RepID=A0ABQ9B0K7_9ROSI|nr:hypothetical protein OIU77_003088 [Salix suchowensis]
MASPDVKSFGGCFNIQIDEVKSTNNVKVLEAPTSSVSDTRDIPKPPPYPTTTSTTTSHCRRISASCSVLRETKVHGTGYSRKHMVQMSTLSQIATPIFHLTAMF